MEPIELTYDTMDAVPEAFRSLYTEQDGKAVLTHVKGMKTEADVTNVQEALRKEREDRKKAEDALKPWKDMDPEKTKATLDRVTELEAASGGKLDEDAINKIVEGRIKQQTAPLERRIEELTESNATLTTERDEAKGTITDMRMGADIRAAATKAKVVGHALGDVEIITKRLFEYDDNGKMITRDGVGVTPGIGLDAFFTEQLKARPHWFPASEGGGAGGAGAGRLAPGQKNPWTRENWNMTEQTKIFKEDKKLAEDLAKAAGTTIGGLKPAAKKS